MTNIPYKLPDGWQWVKLGEVCDYKSGVWGQTDPNGIPVLRSTDFLPDGNLSYETAVRLALSEKQLKKAVLQPGDILLERSGGGPHKPVGRVAYFQGQGTYCCGNFITRLRVSRADVMPRFLFYFLFHFHISGRTESLQTQTTNIRNLRFNEYLAIAVPLPPLEEQKRIVARIEELMTRIKEAKKLRQESKEKAELLWQSALAETFPKPGTQLPDGWQWVKLGEIFRLKNGKFIRKNDLQSQGNIPVYGSNGLLGFTTIPLLTEGRTIVIGRVGACGAINVVDAPCWISDNAMFVAKWFIECDIEYIALALRNVDFSSLAKKGAQPSISQEVIYNVLIPLPPLEEQKRIVVHLQALQEKIKSLKESQTHTETKLKELENSILDKAFKGEL